MRKLLIVDDELDVREFTANFFRKRKFAVVLASNGHEALDLFEREKPNLVLLDIKMERMDGIEVLRLMREKIKDIPVIMVTGKEMQEDESFNRCKELGVVDYIHKPLELDKLEEIVLSILRR